MAGLFELIGLEWLAKFFARYPDINLEFVLDDTPTDLISERIDLALRMGIETGSGFKVRRLAASEIILAASPRYLARHLAPRTLRDLAEHDCLTIASRQGRNMWRLQGPRGSQDVSIISRFAVNDTRVLAQACIAGLGIALLPQLIVDPVIAQGNTRLIWLPACEHRYWPATRLHEPAVSASRGVRFRGVFDGDARRIDVEQAS